MRRIIEQLVDDDLCVGCGACAGMYSPAAAEMHLSPDGFLRPRQLRGLDSPEVQLFQRVCPGLGVAHEKRDETFHLLWGPIRTVSTGYASDEGVRHKGSSGGALSALAIHLLESGVVQGVMHIAPSDDAPFDNPVQISRTREDILKAAGSRYAPASPLDRVQECLEMPGQFAFIGKPCDVGALRTLGRMLPEVAAKFPILMSFMCAGTPGMRGTEALVRKLGFEPNEVVKFRYRGNGWPGMARAETADGRSAEMDYDSSWGKILNRHLQFRCKICPDGTGEFSDVSCADAWHADDKGYPVFTETAGRSLILARTKAGEQLVESAKLASVLHVEPLSIDAIAAMQPYQVMRKRSLLSRLIGLKLALKTVPSYRNFELRQVGKSISRITQLKNGVGTWLRAMNLK